MSIEFFFAGLAEAAWRLGVSNSFIQQKIFIQYLKIEILKAIENKKANNKISSEEKKNNEPMNLSGIIGLIYI